MSRSGGEATFVEALVGRARVLAPNEVELGVTLRLTRDRVDVRPAKVRCPVLDPPIVVGVDEVLLSAEGDDAALSDKEGELIPLAVSELGQVDVAGDLAAELGRDILDDGSLEE